MSLYNLYLLGRRKWDKVKEAEVEPRARRKRQKWSKEEKVEVGQVWCFIGIEILNDGRMFFALFDASKYLLWCMQPSFTCHLNYHEITIANNHWFSTAD